MEQEIKEINKKLSKIQLLLFIIVVYFIGSTLISFINHYFDIKQKNIILQWESERKLENF